MSKRVYHSFAYPDRLEVIADPGGPSMTRQEFSEECDINSLMARYEKAGGMWPFAMNNQPPAYLDLTGVPTDFREMIDYLAEADRQFMTLPAHIRRDMDNDPVKFVEFATNPENLGKMQEWGLAPRPAPETVQKVEVVNTPPPASKPGGPGGAGA